jgi:hypothetical protein
MRSIAKIFTFAAASLSIVACTAATSDPEEDTVTIENALMRNSDYTTRSVCTDCGCIATDVACNCGQPPSKKKLECIENGGPKKVIAGSVLGRAAESLSP